MKLGRKIVYCALFGARNGLPGARMYGRHWLGQGRPAGPVKQAGHVAPPDWLGPAGGTRIAWTACGRCHLTRATRGAREEAGAAPSGALGGAAWSTALAGTRVVTRISVGLAGTRVVTESLSDLTG